MPRSGHRSGSSAPTRHVWQMRAADQLSSGIRRSACEYVGELHAGLGLEVRLDPVSWGTSDHKVVPIGKSADGRNSRQAARAQCPVNSPSRSSSERLPSTGMRAGPQGRHLLWRHNSESRRTDYRHPVDTLPAHDGGQRRNADGHQTDDLIMRPLGPSVFHSRGAAPCVTEQCVAFDSPAAV